jgi:hypothetical protein
MRDADLEGDGLHFIISWAGYKSTRVANCIVKNLDPDGGRRSP